MHHVDSGDVTGGERISSSSHWRRINTQLSLSWRTLDVNKKETDSCLDCDTFELDKKIQGLVGNLIGSSKE